jgi:glutamine synthetase
MEHYEDGTARATNVEQALAVVQQRGIQSISLQFTDIGGHIKGVSVPAEQLASVFTHGQWVDGSSIESVVRLHESDMLLRPDPATFAILPSESGAELQARLICDAYTMDDHPFSGDPRHILRKALQAAVERGFVYQVAPEVEFFVCHLDAQRRLQPLAEDQDGYFDLNADRGAQFRHTLVTALRSVDIAVEGSHHEVATGQHEIDLAVTDALRAADAIVTLKYLARQLARRLDLSVTFMPKPFNGLSGSGMHLHQLLLAKESGDNLFNGRNHRTVSAPALHFIAGQLQHAPAFMALTNPLVNSYKRLASGYEAPATVAWAHENRSALIRVPIVPKGRADLARVELRGSDPACNPYLALAAVLRAGLTGIEEELIAPEPVEEQVYPFESSERVPLGVTWLPLSLGEALAALSASRLIGETLGEYAFARFVELKRREWRAYQTQVTDWEQQLCWETA